MVIHSARVWYGFEFCLLLSTGCGSDDLRYQQAEKTGWLRCITEKNHFSISMPGRPKKSVSEEALKGVHFQIHTLMVEPDKSKAFCLIYTDYPESVLKAPTAVMFDGGQDSALGKAGRLISLTNFDYGSYPAREVKFERPDKGFTLYMRMIIVENRLYTLIVAAKPTNDISGDLGFFFNSLQLQTK